MRFVCFLGPCPRRLTEAELPSRACGEAMKEGPRERSVSKEWVRSRAPPRNVVCRVPASWTAFFIGEAANFVVSAFRGQ